MKKIPLNIILLGEPAAGKATQAKLLLKKYKLIDLDTGKEMRKLFKKGSQKQILSKTLNKGYLAPTKLVRAVLKDKIFSAPDNKGILFDGNPKMLGEAELVASLLKKTKRADPLVLYLTISLKEKLLRVSKRKEFLAGKKTLRADDTPEGMKHRAAYYKKNIAEVVNYFKKKYIFKIIDGMGSIEQVHKRILAAIETYEKKR